MKGTYEKSHLFTWKILLWSFKISSLLPLMNNDYKNMKSLTRKHYKNRPCRRKEIRFHLNKNIFPKISISFARKSSLKRTQTVVKVKTYQFPSGRRQTHTTWFFLLSTWSTFSWNHAHLIPHIKFHLWVQLHTFNSVNTPTKLTRKIKKICFSIFLWLILIKSNYNCMNTKNITRHKDCVSR